MNEKKEPARPRSDRGILQAAQTPRAETLKLKGARVSEEQKEGTQGQGTASTWDSSAWEDGRLRAGAADVSLSLRVLPRGHRQWQNERLDPPSRVSSAVLLKVFIST